MLLQLHLHSRLSTWLQWIGQRQLQDEARNISVLEFGVTYIRDFRVISKISAVSNLENELTYGSDQPSHMTQHFVNAVVNIPNSKVHGANVGPTWVLSASDGPNVGPMDFAIRDDDIIKWKHFYVLLALSVGNSPVTSKFPSQRPVTLHLNKQLRKQPRRQWVELPSCSSWRHCNDCGQERDFQLIKHGWIQLIQFDKNEAWNSLWNFVYYDGTLDTSR